MRPLLYVLLVFGAAHPTSKAFAQLDRGEVPIERAVWVDETGKASLEEVMRQAFVPAGKIVSRGYQTSVTWLRVTVLAGDVSDLWMTIQPLYLDEVRVYGLERSKDGEQNRWIMRKEGDQLPFNAKERRTILYSLKIDRQSEQPTTYYVRLATQSTHALAVKVRTSESALEYEAGILTALGLYAGIIVTFMVLSLLRFGFSLDEMWLWTVVFHAVTILHAVVNMGIFAKYFMPGAPLGVDRWASSTFCLHLFIAVFYYWRFIVGFNGPRWTTRLYQVVLCAFPIQLWLIWSGDTRSAMSLNTSLLLLITFWGALVVWFIPIKDQILRLTARFAYVLQSTYLLIFALPLMGIGEMSELHLYPALLSNLLASVLQYAILSRRDQLALREKAVLERDVLITKGELEAKEGLLNQSASFIAMLLHELKSPLSVIKLAALNIQRGAPGLRDDDLMRLGNIQAAASNMNAVLDRCKQVDQLEAGPWHIEPVSIDLVSFVHARAEATGQRGRFLIDAPRVLCATADLSNLEIVIDNLLENALAYSPNSKILNVKLSHLQETHSTKNAAFWELTVANPVGKVGLPDPDRLFQKYYRAPGAHQITGSGLGLFLIKRLAELSGGKLVYSSELDSERVPVAVFTLMLPFNARS